MSYVVATDGSEASLKAARFLAEHHCPQAEDRGVLGLRVPSRLGFGGVCRRGGLADSV